MKLKAPFPYFGGKSKVADLVWNALGEPAHYIEPFFGSGAVLLCRDYKPGMVETICDKDGFVANVWRSLQFNPNEVAKWCDWPVNHADLAARKKELIKNEERLLQNLIDDPEWYDAKLAGYWIWAASCWIGSGLTSGGTGVHGLGQIPHIIDGGKGVHALGKRPHIEDDCKVLGGPYNTNIYDWFLQLSNRLRYVRVVCGEWEMVCGGNWQDGMGVCGIFFDPPYSAEAGRNNSLYHQESTTVAHEVARWAVERGKKATYRIVIAGYENEHRWLLDHGWSAEKWSAGGGYSCTGKTKNENRHKECLFYSPYCLKGQKKLF